MLGSVNSDLSRDAWTNTPGHSTAMEYDEDGNLITMTCSDVNGVVFVKNFEYDDNGNCINITCSES